MTALSFLSLTGMAARTLATESPVEDLWAILLLTVLFYAGVLIYPLLQAWALWRLKARKKIWGAAPLIVMLPIYIITALAWRKGSNLWPIWMIIGSPLAAAYLAAMLWQSRWKPGKR